MLLRQKSFRLFPDQSDGGHLLAALRDSHLVQPFARQLWFCACVVPRLCWLAARCKVVAAAALARTQWLTHVDLATTHGATTPPTAARRFGPPMIVLPLFWCQYDSAQLVH